MQNYIDYPFIVNGVNFISRVIIDTPMHKRISSVPESIFIEMNIQAVTQMLGDASLLTRAELFSELERINQGGTQAFILLGANN